MKPWKIGLLGLYLQLYDDLLPECRPAMDEFYRQIQEEYRKRGVTVVASPLVRTKPECAAAVAAFEDAGVDAVVSLHLAYSPSLESADVLAQSRLPLVMLDTTPDYTFGYDEVGKLMNNHGIHGVQDLGNLLLRRDKAFLICAGHWRESDVIDRSIRAIRAAAMTTRLTTARVGSVGGEFAGMGDFVVPPGTFGMTVVEYTAGPEATPEELAAEKADNAKRFAAGTMSEAACERTLRACLRLRKWIEKEQLDAFTICFPGITTASGWETVPFLEASKAMTRGIGYAGEGDVLTAAVNAALHRGFDAVSFSEMFCPDWGANRIFLSHMGEINADLTAAPPLLYESDYRFSATAAPVVVSGCFRAGTAAMVNLAPQRDGFRLIVAPGTANAPERPSQTGNQGWFCPAQPVAEFLENYTRAGGTHHLALVYDADPQILADFAHLMHWEYTLLK